MKKKFNSEIEAMIKEHGTATRDRLGEYDDQVNAMIFDLECAVLHLEKAKSGDMLIMAERLADAKAIVKGQHAQLRRTTKLFNSIMYRMGIEKVK